MYSKEKEGKTKAIKNLESLEELIKDKYGL
jgi:hypothetical protein